MEDVVELLSDSSSSSKEVETVEVLELLWDSDSEEIVAPGGGTNQRVYKLLIIGEPTPKRCPFLCALLCR